MFMLIICAPEKERETAVVRLVLRPSLLCVLACGPSPFVFISRAIFPLPCTSRLLSGGAGYIGSHTCVELIKAGEKVRND